jgi:hypothetical protein
MQEIERTFHVPDLDTQAAVQNLRQVLGDTPGITDAEVLLEPQVVRVWLSNPEAEAMVRRHLIGAGYPPED